MQFDAQKQMAKLKDQISQGLTAYLPDRELFYPIPAHALCHGRRR